ncbi:hypothetical protein HDU99_001378, partial [Rhizoclosmatium hyalinum]
SSKAVKLVDPTLTEVITIPQGGSPPLEPPPLLEPVTVLNTQAAGYSLDSMSYKDWIPTPEIALAVFEQNVVYALSCTLAFGFVKLEDSSLLSSYNIPTNSTLKFVVPVRGGADCSKGDDTKEFLTSSGSNSNSGPSQNQPPPIPLRDESHETPSLGGSSVDGSSNPGVSPYSLQNHHLFCFSRESSTNVSDLNVGDSSETTSNVDNFESTGTTPTNLGVQEQDLIISETRGFTLSPFLGSKTPVIAASSAILPTLASVKAVSNLSDALTAPQPSSFVPYTVYDSEADSVSSQSIQSDFESVTDGEFQRLGFNNFSDSDLDSASDMDSVGGLEELLNGISSLKLDSFDAVDLFELEQNLADLDLGYGTAPFISAAGKGKGAKKAKESKPAKKSVKVKAATAKSAKGKGKRAVEDDDADDVEENPPLDPVPM